MVASQMTGGAYDSDIDLLAEQQRRDVLRFLVEAPADHTSLDELVDYLADGSTAGSESIRLTLHHWHLPKLAAGGLVEYDARSGDIRYHPNDRIESLMGCFDSD